MASQLQPVFERLRRILKGHSHDLIVGRDIPGYYGLDAKIGPATLNAWGGKVRTTTIPVAWVQTGKAYVSIHLMGVYGNPKLLETCSKELRARMQGKSCFNFRSIDEPLFKELEALIEESISGMRKAGYISIS